MGWVNFVSYHNDDSEDDCGDCSGRNNDKDN